MFGRYFGFATRRNFHSFAREIIKPPSSIPHEFSTQIIKPSSPTPHHLKHYNLSSMDKLMFRNYMPIVYFFPGSPEKIGEKSRRLKQSLSESLNAYYPFAGRLTSGPYIDCNDEGAEFQESRINCTLSEFLEKYDEDLDLDLVFPRGSSWGPFDDDRSPMIARVNYFDCGGIAIATCLSHIMADATTSSNFTNYWAALTRQSGDQVLPHFISSPPDNGDFQESPFSEKNFSLKRTRYVFKNTELANLKAKVRSSDGQNATRFEFLSTLFYKCAMDVEKAKTGSFRPSVLIYPVNMRSKLVPPLPSTTVGNLIWRPSIKARTEGESSWTALIDESKKEKKIMEGMKELDANVFKSRVFEIIQDNLKFYFCTSMFNMDLYKVNFGWGNPVRVALGDSHVGDAYSLMDTPSRDGIEVLLMHEEQEMMKNQLHKELDAIASLN